MQFFETEVINIVKETEDTYSYMLTIPEGMEWKAGQHSFFQCKDYEVEEGDKPKRVFSIASTMEDECIIFTTRIEELHTSYKENLLKKVKIGDKILMTQPIGNFNVHEDYPNSLVIAGGIGITPVRSIFRHLQFNNQKDKKFTVLYADDRGEFAYQETFAEIKGAMPNLDLQYINDREELNRKVEAYAKEYQNDSEYLVTGSPGMSKHFSEWLQLLGIEKSNIKTDVFTGY